MEKSVSLQQTMWSFGDKMDDHESALERENRAFLLTKNKNDNP
ncbi:MAG TPA: hypothetical protein VFF30_08230 [Nitrososphaerales archaeon]|nr:hypothetical protein [Nitrososphaerales archaeon]